MRTYLMVALDLSFDILNVDIYILLLINVYIYDLNLFIKSIIIIKKMII